MNINEFLKSSTANLMGSCADELKALASWCNTRANELEWDKTRAEQAEREALWKRDREIAEAKENLLVVKLKGIIKPGVILKMKGCKDGAGLREFIRWEGNNLVCWQIRRRTRYVAGNPKNKVTEQFHTNIVTTHMANKVSRIYVDGTGLQVKSILK